MFTVVHIAFLTQLLRAERARNEFFKVFLVKIVAHQVELLFVIDTCEQHLPRPALS